MQYLGNKHNIIPCYNFKITHYLIALLFIMAVKAAACGPRTLITHELKISGRGLVLATKASVLYFYSNHYANPHCFRRRFRHSGSRYTHVASGARASRCACNILLVQESEESHYQKYHGPCMHGWIYIRIWSTSVRSRPVQDLLGPFFFMPFIMRK